jgi:hypothetical protein
MTNTKIIITTDTATLCVFDLCQLKHRLNDDADWWTTPDAELEEMNRGNVAFLNLGSDGTYEISLNTVHDPKSVQVCLKVGSGRVFVGAAEEVTSGGLEPEGLRGVFVDLEPGTYLLGASRDGEVVRLSLVLGGRGANDFQEPILLSA